MSMVRVDDDRITEKRTCLIRPPRWPIRFSHIHGITWRDVQDCPAFGEIWPGFLPVLDGVGFLAAHNASFDARVMRACCLAAGLAPPDLPWLCSVRVSQRTWQLPRYRLPDVAGYLGLELRHHHPESDAEACARIILAARKVERSRGIHSPRVLTDKTKNRGVSIHRTLGFWGVSLMPKKIAWRYHRPACTTCKRAESFLDANGCTVVTTINSTKEKIGPADALKLLDGVRRLIAMRGKNVVEFDLVKDRPDDETLLKHLIGPTGNLRAPSIRVGDTFAVGFNEETYQKILGIR
jgi:DNA polymerase-3 subunit epsilon